MITFNSTQVLSQPSSLWQQHQEILEVLLNGLPQDDLTLQALAEDLSDDILDALRNPLDLNSATLYQLSLLPGLGTEQAWEVLAWRERNGPFLSLGELAFLGSWSEEQVRLFSPYFIDPSTGGGMGGAGRIVAPGHQIKDSTMMDRSWLPETHGWFNSPDVEHLIGVRWIHPSPAGTKTPADTGGFVGSAAQAHNQIHIRHEYYEAILLQHKGIGERLHVPAMADDHVLSLRLTPQRWLHSLVIGDFTVRSHSPLFHRQFALRPRDGPSPEMRYGFTEETFSGARSTSPGSHLRGMAVTLRWKRLQWDVFASRRRLTSAPLPEHGMWSRGDLLKADLDGRHTTMVESARRKRHLEQGLGLQVLVPSSRFSFGLGMMVLEQRLLARTTTTGDGMLQTMGPFPYSPPAKPDVGVQLGSVQEESIQVFDSARSLAGVAGLHLVLQTPQFMSGSVLSASLSLPLARGIGEERLHSGGVISKLNWSANAGGNTQISFNVSHVPANSERAVGMWTSRFPKHAGEVQVGMRLSHSFSSRLQGWMTLEQTTSHPCFPCVAQTELTYPTAQSRWSTGVNIRPDLSGTGSLRLRWSQSQRNPSAFHEPRQIRSSASVSFAWMPATWIASTSNVRFSRFCETEAEGGNTSGWGWCGSGLRDGRFLQQGEGADSKDRAGAGSGAGAGAASEGVGAGSLKNGAGYQFEQLLELHLTRGVILHLRSILFSSQGEGIGMRTSDLNVYGPGASLSLSGSGSHHAALLEWAVREQWTFWLALSSLRQLDALWIGSGNERTEGGVRHHVSVRSLLRF